MIDNLLEFFNDIKTIDLLKRLWIKKIVTDSKGLIFRIYERKYRDKEVKEICKDNKNNVLNIKEYRYDDSGCLFKVVTKDSNGSIEYVNEIYYNDENNINEIYSKSYKEDIVFSQICEYDNEGKIVCDELIRKNNKKKDEVISKNEYTYDEDGFLVKVKKSENTDILEEYYYDMDKNIIEILYKDETDNLIGRIGYAYREQLLSGLNDNRKIKTSINFKGIDNLGNIKDKFYGEYQYDDKNRILIDFKPIRIKGNYDEKNIKNFEIVFLKEKHQYEEKEGEIRYKTILEDDEGNIKQQCFYSEEGRINKIAYLDNGKVTYTNEYVYE